MFSLGRIIRDVLLIVISWTVVIVSLPVLIVGVIFLVGLKYFADSIALYYHPRWIPLSALDLACSIYFNPIHAPFVRNNIGFVLIIKTPVNGLDIRSFRQDFAKYILNLKIEANAQDPLIFRRLKQIVVKYGWNYYWEDILPEESVEQRLETLIWERNEADLTDFNDFLTEWLKKGFAEGIPMWEIVFYKDKDEYKGHTLVLFKMSHVLGDGIALRELAGAMTLSPSQIGKLDLVSNSTSQQHSSWKEKVLTILIGPKLLLRQFMATFLPLEYISQCRKSSNSFTTFQTISFPKVYQIAKEQNAKINEVLVCIWSNALRRHFLESNKLIEKKLPSTILVGMPRVVPGRTQMFTNAMSIAVLPVDLKESSVRKKLQNISRRANDFRKYKIYEIMELLMKFMYIWPTFFVILTDKAKTGIACTFSSFPLTKGFQDKNGLIFGKYETSNAFALQNLFLPNIGFSSTFITRNKDEISGTLVGNGSLVDSQAEMNKFGSLLKDELDLLAAETEVCPFVPIQLP